MALPKMDQPIYRLTIPSTKEEIKYRPFLVKEEKILLMARQDGDPVAISDATKQLITNCVVEGNINVDKLASFDLEFIFLNLRARSVGEVVDLLGKCEKCETEIPFDINLNDVSVVMKDDHTNTVKLTEDVTLLMKYPSLEDLNRIAAMDEVEGTFRLIANCIDVVYDKDSATYTKDLAKNEVMEWLDSLNQDQFLAIRHFFDTMPKLTIKQILECSKCEHKQEVTLEGLSNFFS